jgi:hypothetical protein
MRCSSRRAETLPSRIRARERSTVYSATEADFFCSVAATVGLSYD